jgi:hypothetical protein
MKIAIRTIIFHLNCILIFSFIYYSYKSDFEYLTSKKDGKIKYLDLLLLSTTVQAGVGISGISPNTDITKYVMIIQQIIMIATHIFTIYFFTV